MCSRTIFRIGAFVECKCKVFFSPEVSKHFYQPSEKEKKEDLLFERRMKKVCSLFDRRKKIQRRLSVRPSSVLGYKER